MKSLKRCDSVAEVLPLQGCFLQPQPQAQAGRLHHGRRKYLEELVAVVSCCQFGLFLLGSGECFQELHRWQCCAMPIHGSLCLPFCVPVAEWKVVEGVSLAGVMVEWSEVFQSRKGFFMNDGGRCKLKSLRNELKKEFALPKYFAEANSRERT